MEYNTRMLARKAFTYMGRELQAGQELFASAIDATYLSKVGRAELAPVAATVQHVHTAPVEPVDAPAAVSAVPAEAAAVEESAALDGEGTTDASEHAAPAPEEVDRAAGPEPVASRRGRRRSASQA